MFALPPSHRWVLSLLVLGSIPVAGHAAPGDVSATATHPVRPILIRNEHNPFLKIVVETAASGVTLDSLAFDLSGSDDPAEIEALEVHGATKDGGSDPARVLGQPLPGSSRVSFQSGQALEPGTNTFWLSARLKPSASLAHRIAATCSSVATSAGTVAPANLTPVARHRIGVALRRHQDDGVHTYRIPALTTTAQGTLLAVYDMRRNMGRDLQEDIDTGLSRSTDGGGTWEPVRVIMDMGEYGGLPQSQNGCSDPGIICDRQTGDIYCFAVWMNGKPGKHQWRGDGSEPGFEIGKSAQFLMVRSRDDGRTWSAPVNLTRQLKQESWWLLAPSPQQGIQLADGTLVMPIQGRDAASKEFSTVMTSVDHGTNWVVGTPAFQGSSECQVAQLGDGSLMLNMRNERAGEKHRAVVVSRDLGRTWTEHPTSRKALIEPNCNGSLLRVDFTANGKPEHVLLFSNPHSQTARTHQTIQVSFDDGMTWPEANHLLLDEGRGAGYPSLTRVDESHIGIVYEGSASHLVFEKIHLGELGIPGLAKP